MKTGDLVIPAYAEPMAHEYMHPTFLNRGRSRSWKTGQVALVVAMGTRYVGGHEVLKLQILLDGELWWVGASQAKLVDEKNETR